MLVESPRLQSSSVTGRSLRLIALGGICGLAWSASLRGWMTQLAGTESSFYLDGDLPPRPLAGRPGRRIAWLGGGPAPVGGHRRWRWLALAPALFIIALADPQNFTALIQTGMGVEPSA